MIARLRRRLGYGGTSWLTQPIVQAALGLLAVWILGTMANSLWRAATTDQPTGDQIDSYLAGLLIPGAVLPAVVLAMLGSRLAWALIAAVAALDVLNNLADPGSLVAHLVLAIVVGLAATVVWRFRGQSPVEEAEARVPVWKRINLWLATAAALFAYVAFASTAGYAAHHGNLPLVTPAASMLVAAVAWTANVVLAIYFWRRLPLVLWAFVPFVFLIGYATMSVACPGCSWASH